MTKVNQLLVGLSLAAAVGAVNANGGKPPETCKTNCGGGTTTPVTGGTQTTTVGVENTTIVTANPVSSSSSTSTSGVVIEEGAVRGGEGGKGGAGGNGVATATATTAPITVHGPSLTIKDRLQAPAVAPASPIGIVGGGIAGGADASPETICAGTAVGGSGWAVGGSLPGIGGTLTRSPGVLGYQIVDKDGKVNDELTTKFADCVAKVSEHQRLVRTGKIAPAIVLATDLQASPTLQQGRDEVRQYAACPDPVAAVVNGGCTIPAAAVSVKEEVKQFNSAAQAVPQQEVCPTGTPRAGKPALWNAQIQKFICG